MPKVQTIRFSSVDAFLEYLPDHELQLVTYLRNLVLSCLPDCHEKLALNVPFYYRHRRVCFIWPSSVPWGNVKKGGVQLGFVYGNCLRDEINYLDRGSRKQVYSKTFMKIEDIDPNILKTYLFEAVEIDNQFFSSKKK